MKIVFIALDTLRFDHLGCFGYQFDTTPGIDAWSKNAVLFERCYANDVPTPPSYTAMFSGRFGMHTGIFGFQNPATYRPGPPLVQWQLAQAGYETCALSNLFYTCPWLFPGWKSITPPGMRFQGGRAPDVTDLAIDWLGKHKKQKDLFLFVHYWEPHQPYNKAPEEHRKLFPTERYEKTAPKADLLYANPIMRGFYENYHERGEGDPNMAPAEVLARYDSQIHFVDAEVDRLFAYLDQEGMTNDTMVILTSDHGEAFGEYGTFDHFTCYENISHVPLIIKMPGGNGKRVKGFVYGADLTPTILEAAGLEIPEGLDGQSLISCLEKGADTPHQVVVTDCNAVATQRMIVEGNWGLVHTLNAAAYTHIKPYELFDITGDPEKDLAAKNPKVAESLRIKMQDWVAEKTGGGPDPLQTAAMEGGWAVGHGCLMDSVMDNLAAAEHNTCLWDTLKRKFGNGLGLVKQMKELV